MVIPVNPNQPDRRDAGTFTARASRRASAGPTRTLHCDIPEEVHRWLRSEAAERDTTIVKLVIEALEQFRAGQERQP